MEVIVRELFAEFYMDFAPSTSLGKEDFFREFLAKFVIFAKVTIQNLYLDRI